MLGLLSQYILIAAGVHPACRCNGEHFLGISGKVGGDGGSGDRGNLVGDRVGGVGPMGS